VRGGRGFHLSRRGTIQLGSPTTHRTTSTTGAPPPTAMATQKTTIASADTAMRMLLNMVPVCPRAVRLITCLGTTGGRASHAGSWKVAGGLRSRNEPSGVRQVEHTGVGVSAICANRCVARPRAFSAPAAERESPSGAGRLAVPAGSAHLAAKGTRDGVRARPRARGSGPTHDEQRWRQMIELSADERGAYQLGLAGPEGLQAPASLAFAVALLLAEGLAQTMLRVARPRWQNLGPMSAYFAVGVYAQRASERARVRRGRALGLTPETAPRPASVVLVAHHGDHGRPTAQSADIRTLGGSAWPGTGSVRPRPAASSPRGQMRTATSR
jgi:hypothetical protein